MTYREEQALKPGDDEADEDGGAGGEGGPRGDHDQVEGHAHGVLQPFQLVRDGQQQRQVEDQLEERLLDKRGGDDRPGEKSDTQGEPQDATSYTA